jgi:hypothetical protein
VVSVSKALLDSQSPPSRLHPAQVSS